MCVPIRILIPLALLIGCSQVLSGQAQKEAEPTKISTAKASDGNAHPEPGTYSPLTLVKAIPVDSVLNSIVGSPKCDEEGNFYVRTDRFAIVKFDSKPERIATFNANSSPDVPKIDGAGDFTVSPEGSVHQLVLPHSYDRVVFAYNKDGSYKSMIKLDPGGPWSPSLFVTFPSGNFMATGQKWDRIGKNYVPFTGIFSSDGTLLKELRLEDDGNIGPSSIGLNSAISRGQMEFGADGNAYLVRWLNPAIVYAISPGGEVVRRFTVDPGDAEFEVGGMVAAGSRLALLFRKAAQGKNVEQQLIQIVDLEGNKVATYQEPMIDGHLAFGLALACYTHNPEQLTFLGWTKDEKLVLNITEPR